MLVGGREAACCGVAEGIKGADDGGEGWEAHGLSYARLIPEAVLGGRELRQ